MHEKPIDFEDTKRSCMLLTLLYVIVTYITFEITILTYSTSPYFVLQIFRPFQQTVFIQILVQSMQIWKPYLYGFLSGRAFWV